MAQVVYQGFFVDLEAGTVTDATDLRAKLVMSSTTIDVEDALNLVDFTAIDECDGVGYAELDLASLSVAYDDTNDRLMIDAADGDFTGGTDILQVSTRQITRVLFYRYVDGTDANDVPWFSQDIGPFTTAGGPFDAVWPTTGIAYIG